ncbi:MAG: DNA polymerase III subunit beta [Gammaproteobacteria bacterium]|nr:DNA polymerase III subunit beta [Gammaproteobacteria bacterium]
MRFSLPRQQLLSALQLVSGAVERRQTLPVLANVLLVVTDGQLRLTATDLEVELVSQLALEGAVEPGEITVPARKFLDICRSLPDSADVSVQLDEGKLLIRSGRSRFSLSTLPASEFPNIEEGPDNLEFNLPQGVLKSIIDHTHFAMAQQDVRYYLNGMLVEAGQGRICAVATDGHRLALCPAEVDLPFSDKTQVIVPRKGILELGRLLEASEKPIRLSLGANHVHASTESFSFTSKLVDGRFPDYDRVLPRGGDKFLDLPRESLRESLQRAAILCNEKFRGVRLNLSAGLLRIQSNNPEQEEAEIEMEMDYQGVNLEIGFNVGYLLDVLNTMKSETVRLTFADANSSVLMEEIGGSKALYVVMPMRL